MIVYYKLRNLNNDVKNKLSTKEYFQCKNYNRNVIVCLVYCIFDDFGRGKNNFALPENLF